VLGGAVVGAGVSVVVGGGAVVGGRVVKKRRVVRAKGESTEREMSKKEHTLNVSKMTNPYSQYPLIFHLLFVFSFHLQFSFSKRGV
jgi:serine acetyltransferase